MRKIVVTEFVTLDGVSEDPGGAEGSQRGGWTSQGMSPEVGQFKQDELFASDALLLGRVTYEGFAKAWPSRTDETGFADRMNSLPKYVVSTTLDKADWNNSHLIKGNIAEDVARLKQQPGQDVLVYGSGTLVETLRRDSLVDELRLMIFPVVVGGGKRFFQDWSDGASLNLVDAKTFDSGVVVLIYRPADTVAASEAIGA